MREMRMSQAGMTVINGRDIHHAESQHLGTDLNLDLVIF